MTLMEFSTEDETELINLKRAKCWLKAKSSKVLAKSQKKKPNSNVW